jgi:L-alanine-DL-glutamate epimerase-like enolase superfamily enzyme
MYDSVPARVVIEATTVSGQTIPFAESFPTSHEEHGPSHHVFVRVESAEATGYGEGTALQWFTGETAATMERVAREELCPRIEGLSTTAALAEFRDLTGRLPGHPGAKVAVEAALLDLRARELGVPLHALLGDQRRTELPCASAVGALSPETVAERVAAGYERGYRTFKIKADGDVARDTERIEAVTGTLRQRASPAEVHLRVDANTGWESVERTTRVIDELTHPEYLEYLEQPVAPEAVGDLRSLRTTHGVPVFADEAAGSLADVRRLTNGQAAVSGFCGKLAKTGSVRELVTMARVGAAAGLPVTLVTAFGTSLAVALNCHLGAVVPELSSATELVGDLLAEDPVDAPLPTAPTLRVPDGPGVGVRPDPTVFDE